MGGFGWEVVVDDGGVLGGCVVDCYGVVSECLFGFL